MTAVIVIVSWTLAFLALILSGPGQCGVAWGGVMAWTSAGPEGGWVTALAVDPRTPSALYAGTHRNGVFKSSSAGRFWTPINTGLPKGLAVNRLVADPTNPATVYAGGYYYGVLKTTNGGISWTSANDGLPAGLSIFELVLDPRTSSTLYAGTWDGYGGSQGGVYKSTNGGANWNRSSAGLPATATAYSISLDEHNPSTLYVGLDSGLFKSTNAGASWSVVTGLAMSFDSVTAVVSDPATPSTIYAATFSGVSKSVDAGATWILDGRGLRNVYVRTLAIDRQTPTTLYAGADTGVFKTTNGGMDWTRILPDEAWALALDPRLSDTLYAGAVTGMFKSTSGGASWDSVNSGLTSVGVVALAIIGESHVDMYAGTEGGFSARGGMHRSSTGGASWRLSNSGMAEAEVVALTVDPIVPAILYAAAWGHGVFKSTDRGGTWTPAAVGLGSAFVASLAIDPTTPTTLYAGADGGFLFKSTNGGASWSGGQTFPDYHRVLSLVVDRQNPATVYAGVGLAALASSIVPIFKSTDGGTSWTASRTGIPDGTDVSQLVIHPNTPSLLYASTSAGLFKSTNGGATWIRSAGLSGTPTALAVVPDTPQTLYVGTSAGVFKSVDGGASWTSNTPNLPDRAVKSLAVNSSGSCLYAGTDAGVFTFATRIDANCLPPPPLVATLSTTSQSVGVGATAQTVATVENVSGRSTASVLDGVASVTCGITQLTGSPTEFTFQAVEPTANQPIAPLNTPVDIDGASSQKFVVTLTPSAPICPTEIQFGFNCTNTGLADVVTGKNTLLLSAGSAVGCGLSASVTTSQATFTPGQTLVAGGSVTNPGLPGLAADFYVGVLRPDRSIQFFTPAGIVVGDIADFQSFRPLATSVPLATPFSVGDSNFFTHQVTADDLRGPYVFFVLAVKSGALADGAVADDEVLKLATAPYTFP